MTDLLPDLAPAVDGWSHELPPFAELVAALTSLEEDDEGEGREMASADLEEIRLALAIELEVREDGGRTRVTGSTPTQWTETTVMPAFHRLSMRITRNDDA